RVVQRRVERARPLRLERSILAGDAEGDERLRGGGQRIVGPEGEEAARDRGRHAARAGDRREQRLAVRDGGRVLSVRDVVDGAGIASSPAGVSFRRLSTGAPARAAISSTSSRACAITGSAPSASVAFAVSFMTR